VRELLVISGKGGTGKTTVVGSFAVFSSGTAVLADCDVDASNLHLLLHPEIEEENELVASRVAFINALKCTNCGLCMKLCRFGAIRNFQVDPILCEGCGLCFHACQSGAVEMREEVSGWWYVSRSLYGPLVHAKLGIAQENSGKLVTAVRWAARELAETTGRNLVIVDGPPGIGCPVISSLAGVDFALVITEPTVSGIHDLERVLDLCQHFNVRAVVCINKYDINSKNKKTIERQCACRRVPVVENIPYDHEVNRCLVEGKPLAGNSTGEAAKHVEVLWHRVEKYLNAED